MSLPNSIYSKVVGVTMGDEGATRQLALKLIREHWDTREKWYADLIPDPGNPFDPDAIQVICDVPVLGRTQLGFISNSDRVCDFCRKTFDTVPKGDACPNCKERGTVRRDGLASRISRALREDPHLNAFAVILAITGGPEPDAEPGTKAKSFGCNLEIRSFVKKDQR